MKLVALSGGIASGKTTVAARFAEHGARTINADTLAREAVEPGTPALAQIVARFGDQMLVDDGALDRARLASVVFNDAAALADLNAIVHPAVRELALQRIHEIERDDAEAIIVYEIPLLVEAGVELPWDLVVITDAPDDTRMRRLVELRNMDEAEAAQRLANQASAATRRAIADRVIDTGGTHAHTLDQVDEIWRELTGENVPSE